MSEVTVFAETDPQVVLSHAVDEQEIAALLGTIGVRFERWDTPADLEPGAPQEEVLEAYREDIERLMASGGYRSVDVVSLAADHPEKDALRRKFLDEHTHTEDEVRFFVAGEGLFSLHAGERVFEVLCRRGDLISVPAGTRHWFDMGPNPNIVAIRLFTNPDGWVADFTGDDIAERFHRLEN